MDCTPHCIMQSDTVFCGSSLELIVEKGGQHRKKNSVKISTLSAFEALVYLATDKRMRLTPRS